jgi:hypothetical protein
MIMIDNGTGEMKKYVRGVVAIGVFFVVTGCASGVVSDKRAPGSPGEKTFQIQVENNKPFGPDRWWITVNRDGWRACWIDDVWPECEVDGSS